MRTLGQLSRRWHELARLPVREEAQVIPPEEVALRVTLIAEELLEVFEEMLPDYEYLLGGVLHSLRELEEQLPAHVDEPPEVNVARLAGELADLCIVIAGTADHYGIDLDKAIELKVEANFEKLPDCAECGGRGQVYAEEAPGGIPLIKDCEGCGGLGKLEPRVREDGKILKPDGWKPPDMSWALRRRRRMPDPDHVSKMKREETG